MSHQSLLHEILADIMSRMSFPVSYTNAVDNGDGTYTLEGITNLHHLQPNFIVTIDGVDFEVWDYEEDGCTWTVLLAAGNNPLPAFPNTFELYKPFFFHGTPVQQEIELNKISDLSQKTPMAYLMEPYDTEENYDEESSIGSTSDIKLCFLTQADMKKWLTDDFYKNAIKPMVNLYHDFMKALIASNLFYTVKQKARPVYHTKFGINIKDFGTKQTYFAEKLSGVSVGLKTEMYKIDPCAPCTDFFGTFDECVCGINTKGMKIAQRFGTGWQAYYGYPPVQRYQLLLGAIDGVNDIFQVPEEKYKSGTLLIFYNGAGQSQFTEISPNTQGKFQLNFVPAVDSELVAIYRV
jgi:hypothetical protein